MKTEHDSMKNGYENHSIDLYFSISDKEYVLLMYFIYFYDINNTPKMKKRYGELLLKDFKMGVRPEFREALLKVKEYVDENHLSYEMYFDTNFQPKLLLILCLYIVCGVEFESCINLLFNRVFYGISEMEITPRRVSEECKWDYDIKLTFMEYNKSLFDRLFNTDKKSVIK